MFLNYNNKNEAVIKDKYDDQSTATSDDIEDNLNEINEIID